MLPWSSVSVFKEDHNCHWPLRPRPGNLPRCLPGPLPLITFALPAPVALDWGLGEPSSVRSPPTLEPFAVAEGSGGFVWEASTAPGAACDERGVSCVLFRDPDAVMRTAASGTVSNS